MPRRNKTKQTRREVISKDQLKSLAKLEMELCSNSNNSNRQQSRTQ